VGGEPIGADGVPEGSILLHRGMMVGDPVGADGVGPGGAAGAT
jgi:hypothetical protein